MTACAMLATLEMVSPVKISMSVRAVTLIVMIMQSVQTLQGATSATAGLDTLAME
jgi:hypothetical protein